MKQPPLWTKVSAGAPSLGCSFGWCCQLIFRKLIDVTRSQRKKQRPRPGADRARAASSPWTARAVQKLRARLGLSQEAFAQALGTTRQTIINWERGHQVPKKMASRLLSALERQAERGEWGRAGEETAVDPELVKLVLQTEDPEATARALLGMVHQRRSEGTE